MRRTEVPPTDISVHDFSSRELKCARGEPDIHCMHLGLGHSHEERVIFLEEDVYVFLGGDEQNAATRRSAWAANRTYGPIPERAPIGQLGELLGAIGSELWSAKRRGREACLLEPLRSYDLSTALLWAADCVEHLAHRVGGVDGNIVESLALARQYAQQHEYQPADARRLAAEADAAVVRLRKGGLLAFGGALVSRAVELRTGVDLLGPSETRYEAGEYATADLRAMQVALMHASRELCDADPIIAAREASRWCRRASARQALAQEAGARSTDANEASWWNLLVNPFASGTLARSLPGQLKAIQDGDAPEAEWQAGRLAEYLKRTDNEPLPPLPRW